MSIEKLYEYEDRNAAQFVDIPAWIEQDITCYDVAAIIEGGCASGAYMPAVTYHNALQVMGKHGDDILDYIEDSIGELPSEHVESWSGLAVMYLSVAVELWAASVEDEITDALEIEDDGETCD